MADRKSVGEGGGTGMECLEKNQYQTRGETVLKQGGCAGACTMRALWD